MLGCLGLDGSLRNMSLYRNRLICNFVSALNLRHLDVLIRRVGHFSDGSVSVTLVWTRIHHVIHVTQKDRIVFNTGKKLAFASFPSNDGGLPKPLRFLSSSPSSGVQVIVSDFGFFDGAGRNSILQSLPVKANTVFTSVGLLLPLPVFLEVELSYAPPPGFQLDRDHNTSISSSRNSNKEVLRIKNTLHRGNVRLF